LRPLCSSSNDRDSRRSLNGLGLFDGSGSFCGLRISGRVFEGCDCRWFFDLGWVLIDLGRSSDLSLGFRLEEITNTRGQTASELGLLLFRFLFLLQDCFLKKIHDMMNQ
jgi:hypothetical protein